MKQLILVLVLLVYSTIIFSQQQKFAVTGKFIDSLSNLELANTSIKIIDQETGNVLNELSTEKAGFFSISLQNGKYFLIATHIGYKPFKLSFNVLNTDIDLPILTLSTEIKKLQEVTVEAKKPPITISAGKTTLNISESVLATGNTALELLSLAPGVEVSDLGDINLKGKPVMVYVDGKPSYLNGEQLKSMLSSMQSSSIDKIELMSNPSARYDAAGQAIINIKTKRLNKKNLNSTFNSGIGVSKYLRYNSGIDINYLKNKLNLYGGYDFSHNGNNYLPVSNRTSFDGVSLFYITESENEVRKNNNNIYRAGIDYYFNQNTSVGFLLKGSFNNRDKDIIGKTYFGTPASYDSLINTNTNGNAQFVSTATNVYYKTTSDSGKKEFLFNLDYYRYNQQWADSFITQFKDKTGNSYRVNDLRRDNSPVIINIYASAADYTQNLKDGKIEAGLKYSYIKTDNDVHWENNFGTGWKNDVLKSNYFIYKESIFAAYAGITKNIKKWEFQVMLRTEHTNVLGQSITLDSTFKKRYTNWFPVVNITNKINSKNEINLSYRKSIERPFYNYVNPFLIYRGQYSYFQGNPNMNPASTHSVELAYSYASKLVATLNYSYSKNFIGVFYKQNDQTKIITQYYDNYNYFDDWSADITYSQNITSWWFLNSSFIINTFTGRHDTISLGTTIPYTLINVSNVFNLKKAGIRIELSGRYRSKFNDGFYTYDPYGSLTMGIQKDILKKKGLLKLAIRDIFKTIAFNYKASYQNIDIYSTHPNDSRFVQLSFTYKFGKQFANKTRKSNIESETNRINQ